jgi:hypothetical protein
MQQPRTRGRTQDFLFASVVLTSCFLYALLRLDPRLTYQAQQPVFFFDLHFLGDFLTFPGGINAAISDFAAQLFYHVWTGALLLVLLFGSIAWNTRLLVLSTGTHRAAHYLHWIPLAFLLALHSDYEFPLALSLGLLWTLLAINVYVRLAPSRPLLRCVLCLALWAGLYYVAAGQALVFAGIAIVYEVSIRRQFVAALVYAALAGVLPYVAASTLFAMHLPDAYTANLASFGTYHASWLLWGLYAFFPAIIVALALARPYLDAPNNDARSHRARWSRRHSVVLRLIQSAVVLGLIAGTALLSYHTRAKALLRVDYHARKGEWDQVLDAAGQGVLNSYLVLYQANRALYHRGQLGDRMFSLPQYAGINGLFMPDNLRYLFPLQHSDIFLDLGLVNEAQHWAHEAVCVTGDAPWNLQRLALTSLLRNDRTVAAKYLGMLRRTVWHRAWADDGLRLLAENDDVSACPRFSEAKARMPTTDFLVSPVEPERCLEPMLENRRNKMAFEYFMAYCLLKGDITAFIKHLGRLNDFDYTRIPRHFEEAILIYMQMTRLRDVPVPGRTISPETVRRFNDFYGIFTKHNRNKETALPELYAYADTYWFYAVYYFQPEGL